MERIGLEPGSEIGGYTIVAPLGSGGMGTVYRALDGGGSPVALKLLHPQIGADPVARDRLRREVLALQRLRHPAVAAVLDAEADSTEAFIVTELVAGENLEERVRRHGPLDARALHRLADGLRDALVAVHEAGVVHRDLKPANVLVTDHGPVLIDFGIAQAADDTRVTSNGFVVGTPGYLAPELLDGAEPTAHTDWWGWAALLAFAATGRSPFGSRPVHEVLARARAGDVDVAGLGPITAGALRDALAPRPEDRIAPTDVTRALLVAVQQGDEPVDGADAVSTAVLGRATTTANLTTAGAGAASTAILANDGTTRAFPTTTPDETQGDDGTAYGDGTYDDGTAYDDGTDDHDDTGQDGWDGHDGWDEPEPEAAEEAGYVRPRARRRWGTLLSLALLTVSAAALRPGFVLVGLAVALVLVRTVGCAAESLYSRRERLGVRRSDGVRATVLVPWHVLRAVVGLLPSLIVAASLVVMVVGVLWWLLGTGYWVIDGAATGGAPQGWPASAVLAGAVLLGLLAVWWGPLSGLTRVGTRRALALVAPGRTGAFVVVLLALAASAVLVAQVSSGAPIVWTPLPEPVLP